MNKAVIIFFLCLVCAIAQGKEKLATRKQVKDNSDRARVSLSYGLGEIQNQGDFDGDTGQNSILGLEAEFLKTLISSAYNISYSTGSTNTVYQLEKGYYYYFNGAKKTLRRTIDFRIGANLGIGKLQIRNHRVGRIIYHEIDTWFYSAAPQVDAFYRLNSQNHIGLGVKYNLMTGAKDVFWDGKSLDLKLSIFHSF